MLKTLASEQDLREAIIEGALDCIIAIDSAGRIIEFNPAAEHTFGWTKAEVLGHAMAELIIPEAHRAAHHAGFARLKAGGAPRMLRKRLELSALRADGSEFPVELSIVPVGAHQQQFTAYLRDITDRKRLEEHRKRAAVISDTLLRASRSIGEAESFAHALRLCLDIICELTGWPIGHVYLPDEGEEELVPSDIWRASAPDETAQFRARTMQVRLKPGAGLPGRAWKSRAPLWIADLLSDDNIPRHEALGELRSGIAIPIEFSGRTLAVLEFFTRDLIEPEAEVLTLVQALAQQIGGVLQRKQAEQAIRESQERYRWLLDSTTDAVWRFELETPVRTDLPAERQIDLFYERAFLAEANASMARMYGFNSPGEMIGIRLDAIMPRSEEGNLAYLKEFVRAGYSLRDSESIERTRSGETRYISNNLIGVIENGWILGAWGTSQDITKRRLAELQIRSALAQKEILLREVHHRVKNNLQMIAAMIQLRARQAAEESREHFDALSRRVVAIGKVYEEIHAGDDIALIDLGDYLRKIAAFSAPEWTSVRTEAVGLRAGIDVAVPVALIALELITNAIKHAYAPGQAGMVRVTLERSPDGRGVLTIEDDGRGFVPQASPHRSGLEIVHALASQIDAEVETRSSGGTSHRVVFPV